MLASGAFGKCPKPVPLPNPVPAVAHGAADSDNEAISSSDASEHAAEAHQDGKNDDAEVNSPPAAQPTACSNTSCKPGDDDQQAQAQAGLHNGAQPGGGKSKAEKLQQGLALAAEGVTSEPPQTEAPQPVPSIAEASLTAQLQVKAAQADMSEPERLANDWIQLHLMPTINRQVGIPAAAIIASQPCGMNLTPRHIM